MITLTGNPNPTGKKMEIVQTNLQKSYNLNILDLILNNCCYSALNAKHFSEPQRLILVKIVKK